MKFNAWLPFITTALLLQVNGAEKVLEIVELSDSDFDETVQTQERMFVDFYAPWCGHCQELEPEFKKAANDARAEELETVFAKVDVIANTKLAKQHKVSSYPTLLFFYKGKLDQTYAGDRKGDAMLRWIRKQENPVIMELKEADVEKFMQTAPGDRGLQNDFAMVARVKKSSVRHKTYVRVVEDVLQNWEISTLKFAVVWLPKGADPKRDATLVMQRPGFVAPDPELLLFGGAWAEANIAVWAKNATYPTVGNKFSPKKYNPAEIEVFGGTGSVVVLLDDGAAISEDDALRPKMTEAVVSWARAYPRWRFTFAEYSDLQGRESEILGVQRTTEPVISVIEGKKRWVLEGGETMRKSDVVKQFFADVIAKKIRPRYKSAPAQPMGYSTVNEDGTIDQEGVTLLTGDTFDGHVLNATKDVFVMFYGPDCPHSREMAPEWDKLGRKVSEGGWKELGVEVAKMDATKNECDEEVTSFPKLVLYPAVAKAKKLKLKQMYGAKSRTLEGLTDFLLENAVNLENVRDSRGEKKTGAFSMVERERQRKKKGKTQEL